MQASIEFDTNNLDFYENEMTTAMNLTRFVRASNSKKSVLLVALSVKVRTNE